VQSTENVNALIDEARSDTCRNRYNAKEAKSLALNLADALATERDRADRAEARLADAWDEGYIAVPAEPEDRERFVEDAPNPHRTEATA
jgi:hypothetical protein